MKNFPTARQILKTIMKAEDGITLTEIVKQCHPSFNNWEYISSFPDPSESTRNPSALRSESSESNEYEELDYLRDGTGGE